MSSFLLGDYFRLFHLSAHRRSLAVMTEEASMGDGCLVDAAAKHLVACLGPMAPRWLREQIEIATEQHDQLSADAWRDIAEAVNAIVTERLRELT
jgi:hypothetical protein